MTVSPASDSENTNKATSSLIALGIATLLISGLFLQMVQGFLIALIMSGIVAALTRPLYEKINEKVGGREGLASTITVVFGIVIVILPLILVIGLAASQAAVLFEESGPIVEELTKDVRELRAGTLKFPDWVPYARELEAAGPQLYEKAAGLLRSLASFFVSSLSHITDGTASFFISLFAFLYSMFFFLPMKQTVFARLLSYSMLPEGLQTALDQRIISVSRATIKGSLMIGAIQGLLGGFGFWMAGFEGTVFWAVIMTVLAAIPALGATPVVVGGAIYLGISGNIAGGLALGLWGVGVVGTIDNVLRPKLVGRDAQMSDLWIFVSTLSGLGLFGAAGLVLGPVLGGLVITIWQWVSGKTDQEEEAQDTAPQETSEEKEETPTGGLKLTATQEELEAEVAELRRQLTQPPEADTKN